MYRRIAMSVALALASVVAQGQWVDPLAQAYSLQQRGDFDRALSVLQMGRLRCAAVDSRCHSEFDFARAYVLQRESSRRESSERHVLLAEAISAYGAIPKTDPRYWDALYNKGIALRDTGDWKGAVAALEQAAAKRPAVAGQLFLEMGDIARDGGSIVRALEYYSKSYALQHRAEAPARRAMAALESRLRGAPDYEKSQYATLMRELSLRLRETSPAVAAQGFLSLLDVSGEMAEKEDLFLRWLGAAADSHALDIDSVEALAALVGIATADFKALRRVLPLSDVKSGWWWGSLRRRHALAEFWLATGRRMQPADAIGMLEFARLVAPTRTQYGEAAALEDSVLPVYIALELVQILYANPRLDPAGKRFASVESFLMDPEVSDNFRTKPLLMQRVHTTLGLIYAERGVLRGRGTANAIHQLGAAIALSEQIGSSPDRAYEPLPHVRIALAKAYQAVGDRSAAGKMLLAAGRDYLDLDAYTDAFGAFVRAGEEFRQSIEALYRITAGRQAVGTLDRGRFAAEDSAQPILEREEYFDWLRADPGEPAPFLRRQRFKIFVDLALRAEELNLGKAMALYVRDAWKSADPFQRLVSAEDVSRIVELYRLQHYLVRSSRKGVPTAFDVAPARVAIRGNESSGEVNGGGSWMVQLNGQMVPVRFDAHRSLSSQNEVSTTMIALDESLWRSARRANVQLASEHAIVPGEGKREPTELLGATSIFLNNRPVVSAESMWLMSGKVVSAQSERYASPLPRY